MRRAAPTLGSARASTTTQTAAIIRRRATSARHARRPAHRGRVCGGRAAAARPVTMPMVAWPPPTRPSSPTPSSGPPASGPRLPPHLADLFDRPKHAWSSAAQRRSQRRAGLRQVASRPLSAPVACTRHEVRGLRPRRLCRRAARRARRAHAARGRARCRRCAALAAPGRGRPGRGDPRTGCRRAATSATCRSSATTRPATTPAGRRSRPRRWASSSPPTRSPTAATSSPSATTARWSTSPAVTPTRRRRAEVIEALDEPSSVRRGPLPPRRGVPPHHGRARRLGRRRLHAAPRPDRQAGGVARPARRRAELRRLMDASPRRRSPAFGLAPTRSGSGARASSRRCRRSHELYGRRRRAHDRGRPRPRARGAHRHRGRRRRRAPRAGYDTDYEAQRDAALDALRRRLRPVHHPRRGHRRGGPRRRRRREGALARAVGRRDPRRLVAGLDELGPWRLLLLPDHATPLRLQDPHVATPCPTCWSTREVDGPGRHVHRGRRRRRSPWCAGHELMAHSSAPDARRRSRAAGWSRSGGWSPTARAVTYHGPRRRMAGWMAATIVPRSPARTPVTPVVRHRDSLPGPRPILRAAQLSRARDSGGRPLWYAQPRPTGAGPRRTNRNEVPSERGCHRARASTLERKDRDELATIAAALGGKAGLADRRRPTSST